MNYIAIAAALSMLLFGCGPQAHSFEETSKSNAVIPSHLLSSRNAPSALRIQKQWIDTKELIFAQICTSGLACSAPGETTFLAAAGKLRKQDQYLLLTDGSRASEDKTAPMVRLQILGTDGDFLLTTPDLLTNLVFHNFNGNLFEPSEVSERTFHDFHQNSDSLWFRETVHFKTTNPDTGKSVDATSTFTTYILSPKPSPDFAPQMPVPEIGFGVTANSINGMFIYGKQPFNPMNLNIIKWHSRRTIEWVISRSMPPELLPLVTEGIKTWNQVLPNGMAFSTRMARPDEDLDSPFINPVIYDPTLPVHGSGGFLFLPKSGELFRGSLTVGDPRKTATGSYESAFKGTIMHEIGHTLGLRHNLKGSLYVKDLKNYPAGSSIMEYPENRSDRRIGPYDRDAIRWAYADSSHSTAYAFCSDEQSGTDVMPNLDPMCQKYDKMSANPFETYYATVKDALEHDMSRGGGDDKLAAIFFVESYLRKPDAPFYNAQTNGRLNELVTLFLANASTTTESSAKGSWNAARALWSMPERVLRNGWLFEANDLFEVRYIETELPALVDLVAWVGSNPSGSQVNLALRDQLVSKIVALSAKPNGQRLVSHLKDALLKTQNANPALRLENTQLLKNYF